jgi:recombinational DNA repair protein RecT
MFVPINHETKTIYMSEFKNLNQALEKAGSIKDMIQIPAFTERVIKNFEAFSGREDGANWFQHESFHMMTLFAEKPELKKADKLSIMACFVKMAEMNLSVRLGQMDLIMYGTVLKAEPNYHGDREQLRRMPEIKFVGESQLVFKDDEFLFDRKKNKVLKHTGGIPKTINFDNIEAAYITIEFKDSREVDVIMYKEELIKAKDSSKNKSENGPWNKWTGQMCKKSVLRRAHDLYYREPAKAQVKFNPIPDQGPIIETPHQEEEQNTGEATVIQADEDGVVEDVKTEDYKKEEAPAKENKSKSKLNNLL